MYFAGKRIFFDKKYCTKSFRQPFSNGLRGRGAKPRRPLEERNSIQNKRRRGGKMSGGTFFAENPRRGSRCSVYEFRIYAYCYLTTGFLTG